MRSGKRRERGLTLIELLVAMTIFLVLGGSLVMFLRVGLETWRVGERRRESFERAQAILGQIADDLACTYSDPSHGTGGQVDVIFLSDYDANGRQRLRMVRSLAGEMRHPLTQRAGSLTSGRMDYDYINDSVESDMGFLRAPGGLQEVAYVMDPEKGNELLWRGVKSPIGPPTTLFWDENLYEAANYEPEAPLVMKRCRPFADGILYLEFNFWGQDTVAWGGADEGKAVPYWDSTRDMLPPGEYPGFHRRDSRHEFRDDVFPDRVQVVVVLRAAQATRYARLARKLLPSETEIPVNSTRNYPEDAFQYIKIDDEWIRYGKKTDRGFQEVERGVRGTEAAEHAPGAPVIYGATFSRVIRIPGGRASNWGKK